MTTPSKDTHALVADFSDKLFRFFRGHGVAYAESQDLTNDTFRTFLEKDLSAVENHGAFLWGIAHKKLLQSRTRPRTYEEYRSSLGPEALTSLSEQVDRELRVQALLMHLEDEVRKIFLLRCQGLTVDEIVTITDLKRSKIKRALATARRSIDELGLAPHGVESDDSLGSDDIVDIYRQG